VAGASGCGSSQGATTPNGPEKTHITVAALPIVANAPVFIAQQAGLFRRQGLDVTIEPVAQSTAAIADLLHGSVDVITGANFVSFFRAQARGVLSLKILVNEATCTPNANEVVVPPHSSITKPAQLVGKTVAVNILSDIQTMTAGEVLRANDVDPSRVHYVVVPFPAMAAALAAHRVDAAYEVEPFLSESEDAIGAQPVLDACFGPTLGIPIGGAVTTASWAQQYPNTARAFQRAMEQAAAMADRNRPLIEQVVARDTHVSRQIAAIITVGQFPTTVDAVQLQRTADQMTRSGLLGRPLNVTPLIFR
jgi:NitT/TauT family transport system substrate-binding protein